jgi:hypothetical protein
VQVRLEPALIRAASSGISSSSSSAPEWATARSEAWRSHLLELDLLDGEPLTEVFEDAGGGGEVQQQRSRRRRLGSGLGPEKSASELASLPGSQGEIRVWFPVRDGGVAILRKHDAAASREARLEALEFGDITALSNTKVKK